LNSNETVLQRFDLDGDRLPAHVAVIMDGNGRWAKSRLLNRIRGHEQGAETVRMVVRTSREVGISVLTLYAFSSENWQRPQTEISALMALLKRFLKSEKADMLENNIRFNAIGDLHRLPEDVRQAVAYTTSVTRNNSGLLLNLALSYGARDEITGMVKAVAAEVAAGTLRLEDISHEVVSDHLYTRGLPDPDLLIRTSGELRVSNFLLWQIAYSEIFVTSTLWPDFSREEYLSILRDYQTRERRFGRVTP
jgi:undecaprenyl diphosphate synthase